MLFAKRGGWNVHENVFDIYGGSSSFSVSDQCCYKHFTQQYCL